MVVTRKTTSGGQLPPTSRTSSTAAVPRANKGKAAPSSLAQEVDASFANGDRVPGSSRSPDYSGPQFSDDAVFSDSSPSKKTKQKGKGKKKEKARRPKASSSFVDLSARMFIFFFLIYSLAVCPNDKELQSPVCRGLTEYRRLILDPYIIQPLQALIHHPTVDPYVTPVIDTAKPVIERTKKEWNARVVPQWERHVIPQYRMRIAPHVRRLDTKVDPYRQSAYQAYDKHLHPYVAHAQRYARRTQPYMLLAAARTYDSYQASKPYLAQLYEQLQRLPPLFVKYVLIPLGDARRQFVDPHVALLVEKIKELSTGTDKPAADATRPEDPVPVVTPKKVADVDGSADVDAPPEPVVSTEESVASAASVLSQSAYLGDDGQVANEASIPGATYSPAPAEPESPSAQGTESAEPTPEEASEQVIDATNSSSEPVVVFVTKTHTAVETVKVKATKIVTETKKVEQAPPSQEVEAKKESPVSVYSEATGSLASIVSQASEGAKSLASSASSEVVPDSTSSSSDPEVSASSSSSEVVNPPDHSPSLVPPIAKDENDIDMDDFAAELERELELEEQGLLDAAEEAEKIDAAPSAEAVEESEEEKAERKRKRAEENAKNRRDIEARHTRWEEQLEQAIKDQKKALRKALVAIRKGAAAYLRDPAGSIRAEVEKLHSEADKALRGAEAYFSKLKNGDKSKDEKIRLWDRVIAKVDSKFVDSKKKLEVSVNSWYEAEVYKKEEAEVESAARIVRDIAENGQADIGLPYAWLDDVSTKDWKRYHALVGRSKEFNVQAAMIQNGSHPSPPINPVVDALNELMNEIDEVTTGFETRLSRIRREGDRAFSSNTEFDPKEGADDTAPSNPEVSILPISGDGTAKGKSEEKVLQEVADAILGRSEGEVLEALGRAAGGDNVEVKHEEL